MCLKANRGALNRFQAHWWAPGTYRVRKKRAPDGYRASDEVFELRVEGDGRVTELTAANDPETVDIPVTKVWQGPAAGPVTVRLLADGKDTGKTLGLSEEAGWKGSFAGLRKQRPDGRAIVYSLSEDSVDGYETNVSGSADEGFTVTNTARNVPPDHPQNPDDPAPAPQDPQPRTDGSRGQGQTPRENGRTVPSRGVGPSAMPAMGDEGLGVAGGLILLALALACATALAWAKGR